MSKEDWKNGNSTRSGLLWEVERILKELKDDELPQVLLMENVPQVHSEQNIADFESWLNFLRSRGYYNFYQDLNAKDYGIPQNRVRCFCVSILSDEFIDFEFPKPIKLDTVMRDFLEDEVDEKYYIKSEKADKLIAELIERGELPTEQNRTDCHLRKTVSITGMANDNPKYQAKCSMTDCASTLLARDYKGPANFAKMNGGIERKSCNMLGMMGTEGFEKVRRVYATDALVPAISTKEDRIKILTE